MYKAFRQSIKALTANPVRTGLTTLGIIIGVATVILVLSAGAGFRSLINSQVEMFGTNTVIIETRVPPTTKNRSNSAASSDMSRAMSAVAITTLKMRDAEEIRRLPNVNNIYGAVFGQKVASYKDVVKNSIIFGASPERFEIDKGVIKEGRFYTDQENSAAAQVAILGNSIANDLFGQEDPIGKTIRVGDLNFEVIGVYDKRGSFSGMSDDQYIFIPLNTAQKKMLGIDYLVYMIAQVKNPQLADVTAADIGDIVRRNHQITDPYKDDFSVQTMAQSMESFNTIFNGITFLLIAIAAISLMVGGVGIMNIMYVVVTERTAEIGLKKALGAKPSDILNEFLIEAVLVTIIGGIIGVAVGSLLGLTVSLIATATGLSWAFSVPFYAILLGVGVSAIIGIAFGVFPARSAAKLDPIEALRYE